MTMLPPNLVKKLDPGIRRLVVLLNSWGFATTDRLAMALADVGVKTEALRASNGSGSGKFIQASYDPVTRCSIIAVIGVADRDLPSGEQGTSVTTLWPCPFCLDTPGFMHPDVADNETTPCGECDGTAKVAYDCSSYGLEPLAPTAHSPACTPGHAGSCLEDLTDRWAPVLERLADDDQ